MKDRNWNTSTLYPLLNQIMPKIFVSKNFIDSLNVMKNNYEFSFNGTKVFLHHMCDSRAMLKQQKVLQGRWSLITPTVQFANILYHEHTCLTDSVNQLENALKSKKRIEISKECGILFDSMHTWRYCPQRNLSFSKSCCWRISVSNWIRHLDEKVSIFY